MRPTTRRKARVGDREAAAHQGPLIGVANTWIEIGPRNYHLRLRDRTTGAQRGGRLACG